MSRHYSQDDKDRALELLIANRGDVAITSVQTGIAERTLYRWQKASGILPSPLPPLPPIEGYTSNNSMSADRVTALRDIQQEMLAEAKTLVHSLNEAIADAPLNQRVAALAQLIDRIMKLDLELPSDDPNNRKIAYHEESFERDDPFDPATSEPEDNSQ